ncbi:MAG: hypothetical protein ABR886_02590 [Dehalococcoidales bacterium]|jgi:hypothetical protein
MQKLYIIYLVVLVSVLGILLPACGSKANNKPVIASEELKLQLPNTVAPSGVVFTSELNTGDISFPAKLKAYRVVVPEVSEASVRELGQRLGLQGASVTTNITGMKFIGIMDKVGSGTRNLTVFTESGAIQYQDKTQPDQLYPDTPPILPDEAKAKRIAYDFLKQSGILPEGYESLDAVAGKIEVTAGGTSAIINGNTGEKESQISHLLVTFPYTIDGYPAAGSGVKHSIRLGDRGKILEIFWVNRKMSLLGEYSLVTWTEALRRLAAGGGSFTVDAMCQIVVVKEVSLAYWMEPVTDAQQYILPVYEFRGIYHSKVGGDNDFIGWVPALDTGT